MNSESDMYHRFDQHYAELSARFPAQFSAPQQAPMHWPDGWHHLVREVCEAVEARFPEVRWLQIKEKMGGLRMYYSDSGGSRTRIADLDELIDKAAGEARQTCSLCAARNGEVETIAIDGWRVTLCVQCRPIVSQRCN